MPLSAPPIPLRAADPHCANAMQCQRQCSTVQCRLRPELCESPALLTAQAVMSKIDLLAVYVQKDGYPIEQVSATAPRVSTQGVLRLHAV